MEAQMTLAKFLSRYCNLTGKDLSKLTHDDVKTFFPEIKRSSYEFIEKNPDLVAAGEVLLVSDSREQIIPYYTPKLTHEEVDDPMKVIIEREKRKRSIRTKASYAEMSVYELKCLLNRKFNRISVSRNARRELENRGIVLTRKYSRKDFKEETERIENEGY